MKKEEKVQIKKLIEAREKTKQNIETTHLNENYLKIELAKIDAELQRMLT